MGCCNCSKKKNNKKCCAVPYENTAQANNGNMTPSFEANNSGQVNYYKNYETINGNNYNVENQNYYDNYYNKYNHYYVNDVNYVTDHYYDYNVYHCSTKTVYQGTVYEGSTDIVEGANQGPSCGGNSGNGHHGNKGCNGGHHGCKCGCNCCCECKKFNKQQPKCGCSCKR